MATMVLQACLNGGRMRAGRTAGRPVERARNAPARPTTPRRAADSSASIRYAGHAIASVACLVTMSWISPGRNATSQAHWPKPPAALMAQTHSASASRLALFWSTSSTGAGPLSIAPRSPCQSTRQAWSPQGTCPPPGDRVLRRSLFAGIREPLTLARADWQEWSHPLAPHHLKLRAVS